MEHQHSYSKYELVNMASVRLKSPLRLTPDAKALSFELSCAVALSSLIGRMPLTSPPKRRYHCPCGKARRRTPGCARSAASLAQEAEPELPYDFGRDKQTSHPRVIDSTMYVERSSLDAAGRVRSPKAARRAALELSTSFRIL
jgi:hypothetical protein